MIAGALRAVAGLWRGYKALLHLTWSEMLQYRAAVFIWTLWSLAGPIIHLSVWSSIVAAEGALAGYDRGAIVAYFVVQSVVYHFTGAWQVWDFSYLIRTGRLSARLVKPFDPSHHLVASNVAFKLMNLVWLIPIWTGMYLYFRPELPLGVGSVLTFLLALLLASVLLFLWNQCFAMIAFWTVRASAFYEFADALGYMVGGGIAPVALIPPALQSISRALPYYYGVGFPIEVGIGALDGAAVRAGLWATALWIAALFVIYRLLWRWGLKRFSAVGA